MASSADLSRLSVEQLMALLPPQIRADLLKQGRFAGALPVETAPFQERATAQAFGEAPAAPVALGTIAGAARIVPGMAARNPFLAAGLSTAGEAAGQALEAPLTGATAPDVTGLGLAGVTPLGAALAGRTARAVGRTAVRASPSLFRAAHEKALRSVDEVAQGFRSEESASALFKAAGELAEDRIPATQLRQVMAELDFKVGPAPVEDTLRRVRGHVQNIQVLLGGGSDLTLRGLNQIRNDLKQAFVRGGATPEIEALYGGLLRDLEGAAAAGGEGATLLRGALKAFKADLGAARLDELAKAAVKPTSVGQIPAFQVKQFERGFLKREADFTKLIGPEGVKVVKGLIETLRPLPPENAATLGNAALLAVGGGAGALMGGPSGGAAGVVAVFAPELLKNGWAVGRNPAMLNRVLTGLGQAGRVLATQGMGESITLETAE